jgi:hypothetical protein
MLSFESKCPRENYAVRQFHYLLGIKFIDQINLITDLNFPNDINESPTILLTPKKANPYSEDNLIVFETNILQLISDYFSLESEVNFKKDNLSRVIFPIEAKEKLRNPIIDQEIFSLRNQIISFMDKKNIRYKLEQLNEAPIICLTHDVDSLQAKSWIRIFFWIINAVFQGKIKEKISHARNLMGSEIDEHGAFEKFIEIESKYSFRSTYFFMSLPFFLGSEGRRYRISKKSVKRSIANLMNNNFEIGLHASRKSMLSENILDSEIRRISTILNPKSKLKGVRNHYLSGSFQKIWSGYEKYSFQYDATLGWHDFNGYRVGTSMPFLPYDSRRNRAYRIYELPQVVMDGAIDYETDEEIFNEVKFFVDQAKKYNSVLTISWHTNRIIGKEYENYSKAYLLVLEYLKRNEFESHTASEIIELAKEYQKKMDRNISIINAKP